MSTKTYDAPTAKMGPRLDEAKGAVRLVEVTNFEHVRVCDGVPAATVG